MAAMSRAATAADRRKSLYDILLYLDNQFLNGQYSVHPG
jgi:hypothetical protein